MTDRRNFLRAWVAWLGGIVLIGSPVAARAEDPVDPIEVRVPLDQEGGLDVSELVVRLASKTGVDLPKPRPVILPATGLAGALTRTLLNETLGGGVSLNVRGDALVVTLDPAVLEPGRRVAWVSRLTGLAERAALEAGRRTSYGIHAMPSYRPNDPTRPTICLVHGLNSTSGGFAHMIPQLEQAGFGVVVYDFPDNQDLDKTAPQFARDWAAFRLKNKDARPWSILAHSMGGLIARSYVEGPNYGGDVSDLILIGVPNYGSALAKAQVARQFIEGVRAAAGEGARALGALGEGLGEAADDLQPGSVFLAALNARPRRAGVRYHSLAGSAGFLSAQARADLERRLGLATGAGGFLGRAAKLALGDLPAQLDELSAGTGDGAVSIASTRLDGAPAPVVIPANHVELIRGPLLYPDPGPVVSMPYILKWLGAAPAGDR